jgi:hypothetical protein
MEAQLQKPEFRDELVKPSEIRSVNFYHHRGYGTGRIIDYIQLVLPNGETVFLHDVTSKNQLVSRAGKKISELRGIRDYNARNQLLFAALKDRHEPLLFRLTRTDGNWHCYAVTTEHFTEVTHVELYQLVENELVSRGIRWESTESLRTERRVWKTYLFEKRIGASLGDILQCGIRVANSCKATSSVIFYGFWKRLICSNGMTSSKGVWRPATTHRGEKSDILASVKDTLDEVIQQVFGFETLIERAQKIVLKDEEISLLVREVSVRRGFADYVQRSIRYRVQKEDKTLWGLVNAFTYVSSHEVKPEQSKLTIEQSAHSLLAGGEQMVRELLAPKPSVPVQPVMQAMCRECREKPVAEVGDTCPECDVALKLLAREEDAFDHRMGLDDEEAVSDG